MTTDNQEAAMHLEASRLTPTVPPDTGTTPGNPQSRQVLIRATATDHDRWKQAAEKLGITLSDFMRGCCNERTAELLDCSHPLNQRRYYPWAEFCIACGTRLRG